MAVRRGVKGIDPNRPRYLSGPALFEAGAQLCCQEIQTTRFQSYWHDIVFVTTRDA